jgi:hypothetical protein
VAVEPLTNCRLVDNMRGMSTKSTSHKPGVRQVVGFSLPPDLAHKVKAEAGRRNLSLRKLFVELWDIYEKQTSIRRSHDQP